MTIALAEKNETGEVAPTETLIRRALVEDIDAILHLIGDNPGKLLPRSREDLLELLEMFWVAEFEGLVIGCTCLEIYSPKIAEIRSVAISPTFRGGGLGKELIKFAVDEAQSRNIRQILVVTSDPDYFKKLGFAECLNEKYALFWSGN